MPAHLLLVEDNASDALLLQSMLEGRYPFSEHVVKEDLPVFLDHLRKCVDGHCETTSELRLAGGDGRLISVQLHSIPIKGSEEDITLCKTAISDITQRKEMEETIRRSGAFLQTVIDAIPDVLLVIGNDYRIVLANRAARERAGGINPTVGLTCHQLSHHRDLPCAGKDEPCPLRQVIAHKAPVTMTHTHYDAEGRESFVELSAAPVFNETGEVSYVIEACRDVTDRMRLERALRLTQFSVDRAGDAVFWLGSDARFFDANARACQQLGYSREELLSMTVHDVDPNFPAEAWPKHWEEIKRRGSFTFESRHRTKDGGLIPVEIAVNYLEFEGEEYNCAFVRDITDRKRAEEALARERANLRAVFDVVNVGMLVIGEDGAVKQVNDTLSRWAGKDLSECEGGQPGDLMGCVHALADPAGCGRSPRCDSCPIRNTFASVLQTGRPIHNVESEAILAVDGSTVPLWLEVSADPLVLDGKRHVILAMNDITARKEAEETLQRTAEELARSNQDLQQFASVASHDLQEPLRTVTGFVQLLQKKYKTQLDSEADQFIKFAVDGTKRMETLIKDLLAYARAGSRGVELAPTDAGAALRQAVDNLSMNIQETAAVLTYGELPTVRADAGQLAQLFQNLIGNALKFHGEEPPKIHVDACRMDNHWQFSVRDNGIGIASEFLDRIFLIFERLHTRTQYPGTGIGLAICKRIVDRHGGRIWVESEPGQGATFRFTLPT